MGKFIDLKGKKFNRLVVIEKAYKKNNKTYWRCVCDCGKEVCVEAQKIRNGHTKSCGCYKLDITKKTNSTHKLSNSRLYLVYRSMLRRCYYVKTQNYKYYGGRGIKVCDEWRKDFKAFHDWAMANGYDENAEFGKCTIDRIDNNGNYCPENCRWISIKEQCQNRTNTVYFAYNGETLTRQEWAKKLGIKEATIKRRMYDGWSIEETLSITPNHGNKIKVIRRKKEKTNE